MLELNFKNDTQILGEYNNTIERRFNEIYEGIDWDNWNIVDNRQEYVRAMNTISSLTKERIPTPKSKKLQQDFNGTMNAVRKLVNAMLDFDFSGVPYDSVVYSMLLGEVEETLSHWVRLDGDNEILLSLLGSRATRQLERTKARGMTDKEALEYANDIRYVLDKYDQNRYNIVYILLLCVLCLQQEATYLSDIGE